MKKRMPSLEPNNPLQQLLLPNITSTPPKNISLRAEENAICLKSDLLYNMSHSGAMLLQFFYCHLYEIYDIIVSAYF